MIKSLFLIGFVLAQSAFAETAEDLIVARDSALGSGLQTESAFWSAPAMRARHNQVAADIYSRIATDAAYVPTRSEMRVVSMWWVFDGATQRQAPAALEFLHRAYLNDRAFAVMFLRHWVRTPEDYQQFKADGFILDELPLLPEFPQVVASIAGKYLDYAYIDGVDRTLILRGPFTVDQYRAWLKWKLAQFADDAARYAFLQTELGGVILAPADRVQEGAKNTIQQNLDAIFQRMRRGQFLTPANG